MKLLITIVQNDDVTALLEAIVESGHSATKLSSSGGLLRNGTPPCSSASRTRTWTR